MVLLREFVVTGKLPIELLVQTFRFDPDSRKKDVYMGIEFIENDTPYYYGIKVNQGIIIEEELQISGLGKTEDIVLFSRTDSAAEKSLQLAFSKEGHGR